MTSICELALINSLVTTEDGEYLTILEWIEQKISINKIFTVDTVYMKKILGPEFLNTQDYTIYDSLKPILKKHNIVISSKSQHDNTIFIFKPLI